MRGVRPRWEQLAAGKVFTPVHIVASDQQDSLVKICVVYIVFHTRENFARVVAADSFINQRKAAVRVAGRVVVKKICVT